MTTPLRHRSPVKDAELGPTPNKKPEGKTPVTDGAAAPAEVPAATGVRGFVARNKKLLIAVGVIATVIIIAAAVQGHKNASASSSAANARNSNSNNNGGNGGNGGNDDNGNIYGNEPTNDPNDEDPEDEEPTVRPTTPAPTQTPPLNTSIKTCDYKDNLGNAIYFNALFTESFWSNGSQVEGRLAVGGSCTVNKFSVGYFLYDGVKYNCPNPDLTKYSAANYALVVGGGLSLNDTSVANGGVAYGYEVKINDSFFNIQDGCNKLPGANILDFGKVQTQLSGASAAIASMTTAFSKTTKTGSVLNFNLNGSIMTELFIIQESELLAASVLRLVGTPKTYKGATATIIINVVKDAANSESSLYLANFASQGFDSAFSRTLWNFNGYQLLSFQYGNFPGTILAPTAQIETTYGDLWGGVYARAWNTYKKTIDMKFHNSVFAGTVFTTDCS